MGYKNIINEIDAKVRSKLLRLTGILLGGIKDVIEKKTHVGLDIGNYSVKCAEVFYDHTKEGKPDNKPRLMRLGYSEFDPGAPLNKKAEAIRATVEKAEIDTKFVNISVGGDGVVVRNIHIPRMTREELENALKFEADKYIPFSIDEVVLDFHILPEPTVDGRMHVVLVAAKKTVIESQLEIVRQAGFECGLIDINSFAAVNAFTANNPNMDKNVPVVLLDVGAGNTNLNILVKDMPHFTRDLLIGGDDFTEALAKEFGITKAKAEEMKFQDGAESNKEIVNAVAPVFDDFCEEIQRCFDYFENQSVYPIAKIFVTGGASGFSPLIEHLKKTFKVEVLKWGALGAILTDEELDLSQFEGMQNLFATSIGLGLRR